MDETLLYPLLLGWILDLVLGDPERLPHLVVAFGRVIAFFEHRLNKGAHRRLWGGVMAAGLLMASFFIVYLVDRWLMDVSVVAAIILRTVLVFYCLAGTTLVREVRQVFLAVDRSLEDGRRQVARIVGRDTSTLSAQEVRTAALETLAENLSDGVIAPLFWLAVGGVPAMVAYKMANTLDSMVGYRTQRYREFGCVAAKTDDVLNFIPARLTALLMVIVAGKWKLCSFVWHYGRCHASPNSGYPEAALAGILDCRFGGPHIYFGELIDKPYIGSNDRLLTSQDMRKAIRVNRLAELLMVGLLTVLYIL